MAKPTIVEIAAIAGVSKKTVSRVINKSPQLSEATRRKVEKVIAKTGYVPDPQARALALRRNFLIALVHAGPLDPGLPEIQQGMADALAGSEYALCVHRLGDNKGDPLHRFSGFLEYHRPAGVLLAPPLADIEDLVGLCREFGCGCARITTGTKSSDDGTWLSNDRLAAAIAVGHLVSAGHVRIGFVAGPEGDRTARARELGYLDAMAEHGLDRSPRLIAGGDNGLDQGREAGHMLLAISPRPSAIFAASDAMAAGVLHAAREQGLSVPDDLSLIGFGDTAIAATCWPPLTTFRVRLREMAAKATAALLHHRETQGKPPPYQPELVMRRSVAAVCVRPGRLLCAPSSPDRGQGRKAAPR